MKRRERCGCIGSRSAWVSRFLLVGWKGFTVGCETEEQILRANVSEEEYQNEVRRTEGNFTIIEVSDRMVRYIRESERYRAYN